MSNQVYASSTQKYFTYPGFNDYVLQADQTISSSTPHLVGFNDVTVNNQPSILNLTSGVFTIQETGIYSIRLVLGVYPNNSAIGFALSSSIVLSTTDARSNTPLSIDRHESPAGEYATNEVFTLNYVGWLQVGDELRVELNNAGSQNVIVNHFTTSIIIARIY